VDARQVIHSPVISEKSYALIAGNKYTFRVHPDAHKTQIRAAVEEIFDVAVIDVRTMTMKSKPKKRGWTAGRTRAWKKAIVELAPGDRIELFEGAAAAAAAESRWRFASTSRPRPHGGSRPGSSGRS
jgi:large subunit ribosomal protein L23